MQTRRLFAVHGVRGKYLTTTHHVNEWCIYRKILILSITVGAASIVEENMRNETLDKKTTEL